MNDKEKTTKSNIASSSVNGEDESVDHSRGIFSFLKSPFRKNGKNGAAVRESIEEIIDERFEEEEGVSAHEQMLLANVLHMRSLRVSDVMVPRVDIIGVELDIPAKELLTKIFEAGHSRLPVYDATLDNIKGIVHVKDLLACFANDAPFDLLKIINTDVIFVSPAMRILDLMQKMQLSRNHIAFVVDEYGGVDGLVTIEDLVEQIVGEINDEHDVDNEPEIIRNTDGSLEADARVDIEVFESSTGIVLAEEEKEDIDTIGGLVFHIAGRVPNRGEMVSHSSGAKFRILESDSRHIKKVTIFTG
ncbi:MAG: HlyC/CorC family transporter [Alphaproteobacteria bacterium]|nr:HlyC/CorC family transporter [Alphaproteobacteria bacterium]